MSGWGSRLNTGTCCCLLLLLQQGKLNGALGLLPATALCATPLAVRPAGGAQHAAVAVMAPAALSPLTDLDQSQVCASKRTLPATVSMQAHLAQFSHDPAQ